MISDGDHEMFLHFLAPQTEPARPPGLGRGSSLCRGSSVLLSLLFAMSGIKSSLIKEEVRPSLLLRLPLHSVWGKYIINFDLCKHDEYELQYK